jgi:ABC-2 type transport system ATP-binding protein
MNVSNNPVDVKRSIGYLPEGAPTYGDMTAKSYLGFIAEIRGFHGAEKLRRIDTVVDNVNIKDILNQPIDTLSKGFRRRVGLAQSLLHDPEILIMDEPTDGLDPNQKHQVRTLIREMSKDKAIIISTHILEEVEAVCTRAVIIAQGRLLADGTPQQLLSQASNHNAVVIALDKANANDKLRQEIKAVSGVTSIENLTSKKEEKEICRIRVTPEAGSSIAENILELLRRKNIPIREIFVERGALDDVFREITAPENF